MSNEERPVPTPEEEAEDIELDPVIAEALAGYRAQLEELYENRRRRAIERANMTEEELIASLVGDLGAVAADAGESGVEIVTPPADGEDTEGEEA